MDLSFAALAPDYARLFAAMEVRHDWVARIDADARAVLQFKRRFQVVERLTGVPWVLIGLQQLREAGKHDKGPLKGQIRMDRHLHNGDTLTSWTKNDPANRPVTGKPPFTWESSAVDALKNDRLTELSDWSPELIAWAGETFNGFGYREYHAMLSPYLWSGTLYYTIGKYDADGHFKADLVDQQPGILPVLQRLMQLDPSIQFGRLIETGAPRLTDTLAAHPVATRAFLTSAGSLVVSAVPLTLASVPPVALGLVAGAAIGVGVLALIELDRKHRHLSTLAG
jgi:lysozyme family protein